VWNLSSKCWGPGCTGSPNRFRRGIQGERPVYPVNVSSVIFLAAARAWSRCDLTSSLFYFVGRPAAAFEVCLGVTRAGTSGPHPYPVPGRG